jgi:hypothetical protein
MAVGLRGQARPETRQRPAARHIPLGVKQTAARQWSDWNEGHQPLKVPPRARVINTVARRRIPPHQQNHENALIEKPRRGLKKAGVALPTAPPAAADASVPGRPPRRRGALVSGTAGD